MHQKLNENNIFVNFLVQMKTLKSPFKINWPLNSDLNKGWMLKDPLYLEGIMTFHIKQLEFNRMLQNRLLDQRLFTRSWIRIVKTPRSIVSKIGIWIKHDQSVISIWLNIVAWIRHFWWNVNSPTNISFQ